MHMLKSVSEQQITHLHMKTIQKSRNHNFHMRWLTNYRFLHRLLPTMQQLCNAVTNAITTGRNDYTCTCWNHWKTH